MPISPYRSPMARNRVQFGLNSIFVAITAIGLALAWSISFSDVLGSVTRFVPRHSMLQYLITLVTVVVLLQAIWLARPTIASSGSLTLVIFAWQLSMFDAVIGMILSLMTMGYPSGLESFDMMYVAFVRNLTLPLFGTLTVLILLSVRRGKWYWIGNYLLASGTIAIVDLITILLCSRAILDCIDSK